jgi:hypothetical protein
MAFLDMSQFKDLKDLQLFADKLFNTNIMLQSLVKEQESKISHLESLLQTLPANGLLMDDKEVEICRIEINRLYQKSLRFPLEDKEIRNLEVLVKTLAVAKGKTVSDVKDKKDKEAMKSLPVGRLIELAKSIKED